MSISFCFYDGSCESGPWCGHLELALRVAAKRIHGYNRPWLLAADVPHRFYLGVGGGKILVSADQFLVLGALSAARDSTVQVLADAYNRRIKGQA